MKPVVFVTANKSKHDEVRRLLAGLDIRWARKDLARPTSRTSSSSPGRARPRPSLTLDHDALVVSLREAFAHQEMELSVADRFLFTDDSHVWRRLPRRPS